MRSGGSRPTLALLTMALLTIAPQTLFGSATIFVAPGGNDSNDGSRSSPKRSLQAAHDAVDAGGQVIALDAAGYNPFTITKSISITVASAGGAVIPTSEVGITIAAGNATSGFGSKLLSRGNNTILDNTTDGAFNGAYTAQ